MRTSLRDFDASLYLCEEAFGLLPLDTLERLAGTLLLYPYILTLLLLSGMMAVAALQNVRYVTAAQEMNNFESSLLSHEKKHLAAGNKDIVLKLIRQLKV